jgi:metal-responsive CopG/Arc/MetJ family transcriptional regulator
MRATTKVRVTITISRDVLARVDEGARSRAVGSRSAFIESCLRQAIRRSAEGLLAKETIAYYTSLSEDEIAEEQALGAALGEAARRTSVERKPVKKRRPRR